MGIKIMNEADMPKKIGGSKRELFVADVREIILNEIEFCEITNCPYSDNTALGELTRYAQVECVREYRAMTGKNIQPFEAPIILKRATDENGNKHLYAKFIVTTWKKMLERGMENEKVRTD